VITEIDNTLGKLKINKVNLKLSRAIVLHAKGLFSDQSKSMTETIQTVQLNGMDVGEKKT
jgi:hypothetical protein